MNHCYWSLYAVGVCLCQGYSSGLTSMFYIRLLPCPRTLGIVVNTDKPYNKSGHIWMPIDLHRVSYIPETAHGPISGPVNVGLAMELPGTRERTELHHEYAHKVICHISISLILPSFTSYANCRRHSRINESPQALSLPPTILKSILDSPYLFR